MKNLRQLAGKFDFDQRERKSTQVHARPGQRKSQVDPGFQLASTCQSVWPELNFKGTALQLSASARYKTLHIPLYCL